MFIYLLHAATHINKKFGGGIVAHKSLLKKGVVRTDSLPFTLKNSLLALK